MHAYKRLPLTVRAGKGCWLYDRKGRAYLDMIGGVGSCPLGHSDPDVAAAMTAQAGRLLNASNLLYTEEQFELAKLLARLSGMKGCFFSNSGTEANEAAIKLAVAASGKHAFVACENGFHGRTLGSLSLTHGRKHRAKFEPLLNKVSFVEYGNAVAVRKAITPQTAAVILEPIQGEAGVIVPSGDYLAEVLAACEENGVPLIIDEVQTGNGRTGTYFEYLSHGIKPGVVTTAKGLANGLPIGATLSSDLDFEPGDHASTFGGNSFVSAVAVAVVKAILKRGLMRNAALQGERIKRALSELCDKDVTLCDKDVTGVRGKGLMLGVGVAGARKKALAFMRKGVLVCASGENTIRLLPPLIISREEAGIFIDAAFEVLS